MIEAAATAAAEAPLTLAETLRTGGPLLDTAIALPFPPGLILMAAGFTILFANQTLRALVMTLAPLVTLMLVWALPEGPSLTASWMSYDLVMVTADPLSRLFATVFAVMAFAGGLFSMNQSNRFELAAAFAYAGGAIGVTFAGDLFTVFAFWEAMAVASTLVVWMGGALARGSGLRYAVIHFLGGVILMAGIATHLVQTGSIAFTAMQADSIATWLILAAFLINAGAPPLAAWLPDAYPASSWSGMVFLSAFTTKTAVYALIRGFPGEEMLIWIGLFMALYGTVYAILENDVRRMLAYSILDQVGLMVCAVGIGTPLALNGAAGHAFVHILYKGVLVMAAGSVLYMTGKSKGTELGGLWRTMPVACICAIVGALSIASFPLTSGFVAKSMISDAAGQEKMALVYFGLAAASAGVVLHAGLRFPWLVFFQRDSGMRPHDPPWNMQAAMILLAGLCLGLGIWFSPLHAMLPYDAPYEPYTAAHVLYYLQLLLFSGLAFFLMLDVFKRTATITLDVDWLWRGAGKYLAGKISALWNDVTERASEGLMRKINGLVGELDRLNGPFGPMARTRPSGYIALAMSLLLTGFLAFSFF